MKPCPHCGVMLTASLVNAIRDPNREEACPRRPKRARRVDATVGLRELVPGELAAKRMVALAMLGASVRVSSGPFVPRPTDILALRVPLMVASTVVKPGAIYSTAVLA